MRGEFTILAPPALLIAIESLPDLRLRAVPWDHEATCRLTRLSFFNSRHFFAQDWVVCSAFPFPAMCSAYCSAKPRLQLRGACLS